MTIIADYAAQALGVDRYSQSSNPIAQRSQAVQAMMPKLQMIADLWGGTASMREAATRWLPMEDKESPGRYYVRLNRTFFYNMFAKTVSTLAGKPFSRPIAIKDMEEEMQTWCEDIDKQGSHLDIFAANVFNSVVRDGISFIMVDMPIKPKVSFYSIADAKRDGWRPYFCHVDVRNILGWRSSVLNGKPVITQLRIKECAAVPVGAYGEEYRDRIRVYTLTPNPISGVASVSFELWERDTQSQSDRWVQIDQGLLNIDTITLIPIYGSKRTGFMTAEPPLEDLAYLNVEHWQSSSDQKHVLHVARVPILFASGFPEIDAQEGAKKAPLEVAPNSLVQSSDPNAKLVYVEHTGAAIESGDKDISNIETRAAMLGMQLLKKKTVKTTATEEQFDGANEDSELSSMARRLEDALEQAFVIAARWYGKTPEQAGELTVYKDFSLDAKKIEELTILQAARAARDISQKTLLDAFVKFGLLPSDFDVDMEIEAVANEVPAGLGLPGTPGLPKLVKPGTVKPPA